MMLIYAYMILGLSVLGAGIAIGKGDDMAFISASLQLLMLMPLIGRVLGWF